MSPSGMSRYELMIEVGPADVDLQWHVSNVTILAWLNRAAIEHAEALGCGIEALRRQGTGFVVRRHEIDYLQQAVDGDRLRCVTWLSEMGKATVTRRYELLKGDLSLVRAQTLWAYIDLRSGRPVRMPPEIRDLFAPAAP